MFKQILFIACIALTACQNTTSNVKESVVNYESMRYTKQFGIAHFKTFSQLYFVENSDTMWSLRSDQIDTSKLRIAVLSSVFAGFIEAIKQQQTIVAVDNYRYYNDSIILQRFANNQIEEIGEEGQLKMEKLILLKPSVLVASSHTTNDPALLKRLNALGTVVVPCDNFKEQHPLARAEWIKVFGFICGKSDLANKVFDSIDSSYQFNKAKVNSQNKKPLVMTDAMYQSVWNVPGAASYTAQLIEDAGGRYVFNQKKDAFSFPLNFETVYTAAANADIWIHVNQYASISQLLKADPRYNLFSPVAFKMVFNCNKRENQYGGNDFWERGVVRPDIVLNDLIQIFTMDKNTPLNLYFYNRLD
jgi:iron complex transport system substrate-binding protein